MSFHIVSIFEAPIFEAPQPVERLPFAPVNFLKERGGLRRALRFSILFALAFALAVPHPAHAQAEPSNGYKLAPNDLLDFGVFQEPDMDAVVRIDGDGNAVFPLIGSVNIGGRTIGAATEILKSRYQDGYFVNPQVNLTVRTYSSQRFTVLGQVQKPGSYDIQGAEEITLLQAIGMAGGYTRISDPSNITVKRKGGAGESVLHFNAKQMAKDASKQSYVVRPGDVITVAESIF